MCYANKIKPNLLNRVSTEASHRAVAARRADVGLCVENAAREAGEDFIPLTSEDYYLAWRKDAVPTSLNKILTTLQSDGWRSSVVKFKGVSGVDCGTEIDCQKEFEWWD